MSWYEDLFDWGGGGDDWSMVNDGVYNGNTGWSVPSDWSMTNDGMDWESLFGGGESYGESSGSDWSMFNGGGGSSYNELYNPYSVESYSSPDWSMTNDGGGWGAGSPDMGQSGGFTNLLTQLGIKKTDKKGENTYFGQSPGQLLKLALGMGASYLGNKSTAQANQDQARSNQADYLKNVTWTPERTAAYTNAVRNNVSGLLSGQLAQGKGKMSEQLASAGRGGGSFGKASDKMTRNMLNSLASATNQAIQTTSTPPNLSYSAFNIPADTSTGNTLSNISGFLGNQYNQDYTIRLLRQLLGG